MKSELQQEYERWLADNLPSEMLEDKNEDLSADNLMACVGYDDDPNYKWSPNKAQYAWLANFCERWDAHAKKEHKKEGNKS